jgi:hypothetical protein
MIPTMMLGGALLGAAAGVSGGGGGGVGATWNPLDKTTGISLSSADFTAAASGSTFEMVRCTLNDLNTSVGGKFYWEMLVDTLDDVSDIFVGIRRTSDAIASASSPLAGTHAYWRGNGSYFTGGGWSSGSSPASIAASDVLMFALDVDNGRLFVGKNGTWNNSGDPAAGTNASFTNMPTGQDSAPFFSTDNVNGNVQVTLITDPSLLNYSAPSGFTAGLAAP